MKKFLFALLFCFLLVGFVYADEVDFYSEANQNTQQSLHGPDSRLNKAGQAITLVADTEITSIKWYLREIGSFSGNMYAVIFASTGTVGSSAKPTGSVLATSDAINVSVLTTSFALIEFTFSTPYNASAGDICIGANYTGGSPGNELQQGDDDSSPSHAGNGWDNNAGSFRSTSNLDYCFYLYGNVAAGEVGQIF